MKSLLRYLFLCSITIQISFGQDYLLDSSSILLLLGNTNNSLDFKKYTYDDQNRILQITGKFQVKNYDYHNVFDHSIITHNPKTNLFSPREDNYYNANGSIIRQELHIHDSQSNVYSLDKRKLFEYDQENRLIKELHFFYSESGDEYLTYSFNFNYFDEKLINRVRVYYIENIPASTTSTDYQYLGEYLIEEQQHKTSANIESSYFKIYEYNSDNSLKSYVQFQLFGADTLYQKMTEYVHSENAIEMFTSYYYHSIGSYEYNEEYSSYAESPFYEKDTFIASYDLFELETTTESRLNSTQYSVTGDSAFVRREYIVQDLQNSSLHMITKDLYLKNEGSASEILKEDMQVAYIYPSPAAPNSTIIIQKMLGDVDRMEIYNNLGQKVENVYIGNRTQIITLAPSKAGNYFLLFYANNRRIGKIEQLVIQD